VQHSLLFFGTSDTVCHVITGSGIPFFETDRQGKKCIDQARPHTRSGGRGGVSISNTSVNAFYYKNMAPRAPIQIGINPTMAAYTIILGGVCAAAAYSEKYRRNQDDIDDKLLERYATNMREQHEKIPQITQAIRGQDMRVDGTMNKWVWGGKAALPVGGPTGRGHHAKVPIIPVNEEGSENEKPTSTTMDTKDEVEEESQLSNKERRRRQKERKQKRREERAAEQKRLEAQRQKLVLQSVAAGATVGAVAVAVSVFFGVGKR
jgi:hypothetical protein